MPFICNLRIRVQPAGIGGFEFLSKLFGRADNSFTFYSERTFVGVL